MNIARHSQTIRGLQKLFKFPNNYLLWIILYGLFFATCLILKVWDVPNGEVEYGVYTSQLEILTLFYILGLVLIPIDVVSFAVHSKTQGKASSSQILWISAPSILLQLGLHLIPPELGSGFFSSTGVRVFGIIFMGTIVGAFSSAIGLAIFQSDQPKKSHD